MPLMQLSGRKVATLTGLVQVVYNDDGDVITGPEETDYVTYFYGEKWPYDQYQQGGLFTISHLDIVCYSKLEEHISSMVNIDDFELCEFYKEIEESEFYLKRFRQKRRS